MKKAAAEPFRIELAASDEQRIPLASLRRDPELSCRAQGINRRTVGEYAAAMQAGAAFPPVVVYLDGKGTHWLADGYHRCAATELAGLADVAADVRQGDRRAALLHAASANAAHGLRRTSADKRHAVELVLAAFGKWSDRKIADACGVDGKTVAAVRRASAEIPQLEREGADGKVRRSKAVDFDATAELAKVGKVLERLVERLPVHGAARAELGTILNAWAARLVQAPDEAATPEPKPARPKRATGEAASVSAVAS